MVELPSKGPLGGIGSFEWYCGSTGTVIESSYRVRGGFVYLLGGPWVSFFLYRGA